VNDSEAIQRKLTELDLKIDLLSQRMFAYVTAILQILHNQGVVNFREMLHYLNQNEKDLSSRPASREDSEFFRLMRPLLEDDDWGNASECKRSASDTPEFMLCLRP